MFRSTRTTDSSDEPPGAHTANRTYTDCGHDSKSMIEDDAVTVTI